MADFLERIGTTTTVTKNVTTTIRSSSGSIVTESKTQTKELDLPTSASTSEQTSKSTTIITRKSTGSSLISNPSIEEGGNSNESTSPVARFLSRLSSSANISPSVDPSGVLSFLQDHLQELKDLQAAIGTVLSEVPSHLPPKALSSSSGFNVSAVQSPIRHSEISKVKNLLRAPSPPLKSKFKSKVEDEDDDDEDDEADEDDDDEDVDDDGDDDEDDSKVIYIDDEAPGESSSRISLHSHQAIKDVSTWISLKVESIQSYLVKLHETVGTNSHSTPISIGSRGVGSRMRPQSLFLPLPLSSSPPTSHQTDSNRGEEEGEEEGGFFVDDDGDDSFDEDALFNEDLEGEDFESDTEGEGKDEEEGKGGRAPELESAPTATAETTTTTTELIATPENKEKGPKEEAEEDLRRRQGAFIKRQPSGTGSRAFPPLPPTPTTTPPPTHSPSTPSPKVQTTAPPSTASTPVAAAPATSALQWLLMNPQAQKTSARPTTPRRGGTMSRATRLEMEKELEAKTKQQRLNVFKEVLSTEREYVNSLQLVIDIYLKPIRENKAVIPNMPPGTSLLTSEEIQSMFANIEEVWQVSNTLVTAFEEVNRNIIREPQSEHFILLAEVFVGNQEKLLRAYTPYVGNHQVAFTTYQILLADPTRPFFSAFVKLAERNPKCKFMDLLGFLIKPVQRICKYPLLFKEMAKNSRTTDMEYEPLLKAQRAAEAITNDVNELKRLSENMSQLIQLQSTILGCRNFQLISSTRKLIREGIVIRVSNKVQKERRIILFNDLLVSTKIDRANPGQSIFEGRIELASITVNDITDSFQLKNIIEIAPRTADKKEKSVTLLFSTPEEKTSWLTDIRNAKQGNTSVAPLQLKTKGSQEVLKLVNTKIAASASAQPQQ